MLRSCRKPAEVQGSTRGEGGGLFLSCLKLNNLMKILKVF